MNCGMWRPDPPLLGDFVNEYDEAGNLLKMTMPNGIIGEYKCDANDRVTEIKYSREADGVILEKLGYGYDDVGNVIKKTDAIREAVYGYDDLYRLTSVDYSVSLDGVSKIEYGYTPNGNRDWMKHRDADGNVIKDVNYNYGPHNILQSDDEYDYVYYPDGNLKVKRIRRTSRVVMRYLWDDMNRLSQVINSKTGMVVRYMYDASGRRTKRINVTTGEIRSWSWDGITEVCERTGTGTGQPTFYVNGTGGNLAKRAANGNVYFYLKDHLGSVIATLDEHGNLVQRYDYDPFGECLNYKHDPTDNRSFTGKRYDEDAELYYFQARWYDAEVGRFVSRDPVMGNFSYSLNNPTSYYDVMGLVPMSIEEAERVISANNASAQVSNEILLAIAYRESRFDPGRESSGSSAVGMMMMTTGAAKDVGYSHGEMKDPAKAVEAASKYLDLLIKRWGSLEKALEKYRGENSDFAKRLMALASALANGKESNSQKKMQMLSALYGK